MFCVPLLCIIFCQFFISSACLSLLKFTLMFFLQYLTSYINFLVFFACSNCDVFFIISIFCQNYLFVLHTHAFCRKNFFTFFCVVFFNFQSTLMLFLLSVFSIIFLLDIFGVLSKTKKGSNHHKHFTQHVTRRQCCHPQVKIKTLLFLTYLYWH